MEQKKTIFITSFHGLVSRILESGVLEHLLKQEDICVVIFVPDFKKDYFEKVFGFKPNVFIEGIGRDILPRRTHFFHRLSSPLLNTKTMSLTRRSFRGYRKVHERIIAQTIATFFGRWSFVRNAFRAVNYYFPGKPVFHSYFDQYNPILIFSTDIKEMLDTALLIEAKKRGITTVGMIRSWDYLTGKGMTRIRPHKMIVHNKKIRDEAITYADMDEKDIFISGLPHFDPYINHSRSTRAEFFTRIGVDSKKRLLLYVPWGDKFSDSDSDFIGFLSGAIEEGELPSDLHILVRFPPGDTVSLKKYETSQNVSSDVPGIPFGNHPRKANEMSFNDLLHLANTLYYSDVVVAPPSTMVIDACAFNKPVVLMAFDGREMKDYFLGIRHYYKFNHIQHLVQLGGAPLAKSKESLITYVHNYLKNPDLDSSSRKEVVEKQCFVLDGKSSERIANYLRSLFPKE